MTAVPALSVDDSGEVGYFSDAARQAALVSVLPTLSTYFASSAALRPAPIGVDRGTAQWDDTLTAGLRLRVALAGTRTLAQLLQAISGNATFRYQQRRHEEFDLSHGTLDVTAYLSATAMNDAPRRFPIATVERTYATPENILLAYTVVWLRREIGRLLRTADAHGEFVIPRGTADQRAGQQSARYLLRLLNEPFLRSVTAQATLPSREIDVLRLLESVRRRLKRREVPNPQPYSQLIQWVTSVRSGEPVASPGTTAWDIYDAHFDARLFELWCLHQLLSALSHRLAAPVPTPDLRRRTEDVLVRWQLPFGCLDSYFQRSPQTIDPDMKPRWRRASDPDRGLIGIPDITFHADFGGVLPARLAFVDPKLRQRRGVPTEEVFKLLGYFNDYQLDDAGVGAILYYAPHAELQIHEWVSQSGHVIAVGVDPTSADDSRGAFAAVADLLLGLFGVDAQALTAYDPGDGLEDRERSVATRQAITTQYLMREAARLGAELRPARRALETAVGVARWRRLPQECRTMLATAHHLASAMEEDLDHSGPVLGTCAAIERLLLTQILDPAKQDLAHRCPGQDIEKRARTLGGLLTLIRQSLATQDTESKTSVHNALAAQGVDATLLAALLPRLETMNSQYRIPAAHSDVMSAAAWREIWQLMYTGLPATGGGPHQIPLLTAIIDVLIPTAGG